MVCVLVLASGATWESDALSHLAAASGVVVLKRCVDVDDLMATAATGQAEVAVVSLEAPGLDAAAVAHLRRQGVRPVGVVRDTTRDDVAVRLARLDVRAAVAVADLASLPRAVTSVDDVADTRARGEAPPGPTVPPTAHRVVAVWGPAGAPGRTTVATAFACELARRGTPTLLVDADPHAASVAQHLGVLDQVSGVLSAARLAATGALADRFTATARAVSPTLGVLTGLPRSDRWVEVRPGAVSDVLAMGRERAEVVVDTGFDLAEGGVEPGAGGQRNAMTLEALGSADEVLVVGAADPVGLSRLARGLVELREVVGDVPVRVAVNRMRASLGWSPADVAGMVEGFARVTGLHFLPEDRSGVDRALVAGRAVGETGESPLSRAVAELVDVVHPTTYAAGQGPRGRLGRRVRRRTAGTAHPR